LNDLSKNPAKPLMGAEARLLLVRFHTPFTFSFLLGAIKNRVLLFKERASNIPSWLNITWFLRALNIPLATEIMLCSTGSVVSWSWFGNGSTIITAWLSFIPGFFSFKIFNPIAK